MKGTTIPPITASAPTYGKEPYFLRMARTTPQPPAAPPENIREPVHQDAQDAR